MASAVKMKTKAGEYLLALSGEEALVLYALSASATGCALFSPRRALHCIGDALANTDLDFFGCQDPNSAIEKMMGLIESGPEFSVPEHLKEHAARVDRAFEAAFKQVFGGAVADEASTAGETAVDERSHGGRDAD